MGAQELTAEDIWELFRETGRMFRETDRKFQETDRKFQETDRKFQETDRRFQETDRKFQETDRKFAELSDNLDGTRREVGSITDTLGRFAENMVGPAVVRLFAERGIALDGTAHRVGRRRNGRGIEIDVLAVNRETVVAVEVKMTLRVDDIREFVEKLEDFRTFFREYRDYELIGAVAGMSLQEGVEKYAERQGLYVLAQSGDAMHMLNSEDFEARVW